MWYAYYSVLGVFLSAISFFFFNDTATTEIYTLSLHDALPIPAEEPSGGPPPAIRTWPSWAGPWYGFPDGAPTWSRVGWPPRSSTPPPAHEEGPWGRTPRSRGAGGPSGWSRHMDAFVAERGAMASVFDVVELSDGECVAFG